MSAAAKGLNVRWFEETATGWQAVPLFEPAGMPPPEKPTLAQQALLRNGEACSLFVPRPHSEADLSFGYAAVLDQKGAQRAILAVSNRDTVLRAESNAALHQCLGIVWPLF